MATKRLRRLVSFLPEEYQAIKDQAAQVRLSPAEYMRRQILGLRLPNAADFAGMEAIGDLLSVNANMARVGNLLKLALDEADGQFGAPTVARIEDLVKEIRDTQAVILGKVEDLHFQIHPNRKRRK